MFLAVREIRFAKGRFALMGAVVALISVLLVMLSGLTAGLARQSTSAIDSLPVSTVAFGSTEDSAQDPEASYTTSQVTSGQLRTWQGSHGVSEVEALGITQTRLTGTGTGQAAVFGVAPESRLAPQDLAAGEVVLSETLAEEVSAGIGDTVTLGNTELQVTGVVADQWYSHTAVAWTDVSDWKTVAHVRDADVAGTVIAANYDPQAPGAAALEDIDAAAHTLSQERTESFSALASYSSENGSLTLIQGFLYGISALVIAAFLSVWTVQRTREIAVLKALGASTRYVLGDALAQAALVLVAGVLLGGALGIGGGIGAATVAPFAVSAATTVLPMAGIVAVGLVAAVFAVRRVTKVDPLLALGGN